MLDKFRQIKKQSDEEDLIEIHHILMKEYGYIPLEELRKIPIPTILELLDQIEKYHREMERAMRRRR